MNDSRTTFLLRKQQLGMTLTEDERRELADTPEFVGERDANGNFVGGVMVVPRRPTGTYEEQLRQFARLQNMDGSEPDRAQIDALVSGRLADAPQQSPVEHDEWADDSTPPVEQQPPAPVVEPPPVPATEALQPAKSPARNDDVPTLPAGYTYVRALPNGKIVALFKDESLPRSPAREVVIDSKRLRKQRAQTSRAASLIRRASSDGSGKVVRE